MFRFLKYFRFDLDIDILWYFIIFYFKILLLFQIYK